MLTQTSLDGGGSGNGVTEGIGRWPVKSMCMALKKRAYLVDLAITDALRRGEALVDDGGAEGRWSESAWGGGGREGSLREDAVQKVSNVNKTCTRDGKKQHAGEGKRLNWRAIGAGGQG